MKGLTRGRKMSLFSLFGLFGFLGLTSSASGDKQYFFLIFFAFFAFYWAGKIFDLQCDERLDENRHKAMAIGFVLSMLLNFLLVFMLSNNNIDRQIILLIGALGYAILFNICFAIVYFLDKGELSE